VSAPTEAPADAGLHPLTPTYAIAHRTPTGDRYLVPITNAHRAGPGRRGDYVPGPLQVVGVDVDGNEVDVQHIPGRETRAYSGEHLPGYLLSAVMLAAFIVRWTIPGGLGEWRKRSALAEGADAMVRAAWENALEVPDAGTLAHLETCEHIDSCLGCLIAARVYAREKLPNVPREQRVELAGLELLPGDLDPNPDIEWVVDDPTLLHVYGRHTAHLWPGTVGGVRRAVVDALNAHPMCAPYVRPTSDRERYSILGGLPAYLSDHGRREDAVELNVPIPWDVPRQTTRAPHGRERKRQPVTERIAMHYRRTIVTPDRLRAANKAAALARLPEYVAEVVANALPDAAGVAGCTSCGGKGFHTQPLPTP
jgi:hypothetical protein